MDKQYDSVTAHVYETVCHALDVDGIYYERHMDRDMVYAITHGVHREYSLALVVNERRHTLFVCLNVPLDIPRERASELLLLLAHLNLSLPRGSFACRLEREPLRVDFQLMNCYEHAMFSEETVRNLVSFAVQAADVCFPKILRFREGDASLYTLLTEDIS